MNTPKNQRRVGVMTWFTFENYGSVLQAFALCKVLYKFGVKAELINYRPRQALERVKRRTITELASRAISKIARHSPDAYSSKERSELFKSFVQTYLPISSPANSFPELQALACKYDAVVCGSDQIWSPSCFDENFFLPYVSDANRKIAYAPSFGVSSIGDDEILRRTKDLLGSIGWLSVRERQGARIIIDLIGSKPEVTLDPTFLLSKTDWDNALDERGGTKSGYLLCYFLGNSSKYEASVKKHSERLGLPVVTIPTFCHQANEEPSSAIGPLEFVRLFLNASYVCTDSFHGTAFSINFEIPFTAYKRFSDLDKKSQNSRIIDILSLMGLEDRLLHSNKGCPSRKCDFSEARSRLARMRNSSLSFLEEALSGAFGVSINRSITTKPLLITDRCCGCGSCAAVCPKGAISIVEDESGFLNYEVDNSQCVACGACISICPMRNVTAPRLEGALGLYSYKSADSVGLRSSSSGGIGADLAATSFAEGRRTFGCAYNRVSNCAEHMEAQAENINSLRGSKYLQSRSLSAISSISSDTTGYIAFFGTPCQVAGVDAILRRKTMRESAILVDLICHGVPTQNLWRRYLAERESCDHVGAHPDVSFRWKENGWSSQKMLRLEGAKGSYSGSEPKDDFYAFFDRSLCNSKSCYECPYRERSAADLRIGDYWGPKFTGDDDGVSMVVAMTDSGKALVEALECRGARVEPEVLSDYWSCQLPYNQGLPLGWEGVVSDLSKSDAPLSAVRKKWCAGYDQRDYLERVKRKLKTMFMRGLS